MQLKEYHKSIALHETYNYPGTYSDQMLFIKDLNHVIHYLVNELDESLKIPETNDEKLLLVRGLLNQRLPGNLPDDILEELDRILWTERWEKGIVKLDTIPQLWKGDITRLKVDAIVNAANSDMLGCFHPLHACIDNAIHSAAGPRLREDCHKIMQQQGDKEKTGTAKITRAYNLPSKYVLHTVGPIVQGSLTDIHRELLESCYTACLDLASKVNDLKSIAFCCISTGVFGYPKNEAAQTAIGTVKKWEEKNPERFDRIIFNVFTEEDYEIYTRYL